MAKFLMDQAQQFWDNLDFQAFEDILALLIYGLVLFPNPDSFTDVNTVKIFCRPFNLTGLLSCVVSFHYVRIDRVRKFVAVHGG